MTGDFAANLSRVIPRRRVVGPVVALLLLTTVAIGVPSATSALADPLQSPPACATTDPDTNCVHAPTPDLVALPGPAWTSTYNPVNHQREVTFVGTINPPHPTCPTGGVPAADIPCTFAGLGVTGRIYVPGAKAAAGVASVLGDSTKPCVFSCTYTMDFNTDYYGPATVILSFIVNNVILAANDLSFSTYESTIELPANPAPNLIHVVKPAVAYTGKLKTMSLQLAGKHGIPKVGVGGVIVQLVSSGFGFIQDEDPVTSEGQLEIVAGTKLKLTKRNAGTLTVRVMGWYAKAPSTTGSLFHALEQPKRVKTAATMSLGSAGVPADATGVTVAVIAGKGTTVVGGVTVPHALGHAQYLLLPLKAGLTLSVKNTRAVKVIVYGYTEPVHPVDEGLAVQLPQPGYAFSDVFHLPGPLGIS